jgi:hypothetical protein
LRNRLKGAAAFGLEHSLRERVPEAGRTSARRVPAASFSLTTFSHATSVAGWT